MAALEQLQTPYADWAARAAALAQQLPSAIAASVPQQAPAVQVGNILLQLLIGLTCSLQAGPQGCNIANYGSSLHVWADPCSCILQAALAAQQAWLGGAAAQASGLVRLAAAVLALERSFDSGGGGGDAARSDSSFAQHAALLAQLTELGPQLATAQRQVWLHRVVCLLQAC